MKAKLIKFPADLEEKIAAYAQLRADCDPEAAHNFSATVRELCRYALASLPSCEGCGTPIPHGFRRCPDC